jgi:glycosyltransferase involved in cell wall biosynthesis
MRILVDYRPAVCRRTGVGEYMHEVTRAYAATFDDEVAVFSSSWADRPAPGLETALQARVVDRRIPVRVLNYLWHRWEWPPVEWLAGPVDVVHSAHPLLIPARRAAQVVTIHDLFFMEAPERTQAEIRRDYPTLTPAHARRADAIVTPSAYTKRLVQAFGVPADRIHVCSLGAPRWRTLGGRPHLPPDGCVLFVGTLEPRKNIGTLLDAYEQLTQRRSTVPPLILAGGATPDAAPWLERIQRPPLAGHVRHVGYIPHDEREAWYARARVVVLPSLDEGFGLPVLEAMAAGIPVVGSNRGALPEVTGGAADLVDATDAAGFARAIERLLTEPGWAESRAVAGLDRAATYTWETTAQRLHEAYLSAWAHRQARATHATALWQRVPGHRD